MSTRPSFQDRLRSRPLRDLQAGSEELWAYRDAAAMLATFDFQELQPFQAEPSTEARSQLLADCDVTTPLGLPPPSGACVHPSEKPPCAGSSTGVH